LESIPGLHKRLKIRALVNQSHRRLRGKSALTVLPSSLRKIICTRISYLVYSVVGGCENSHYKSAFLCTTLYYWLCDEKSHLYQLVAYIVGCGENSHFISLVIYSAILSAAAKIRSYKHGYLQHYFSAAAKNRTYQHGYLQCHFSVAAKIRTYQPGVIYSAILSAAAKNRITQLLLAHFTNATWVDGPGPKEIPL
jgi:hypothetical protein